MNCPHCGAENPSGAKFCRKCGNFLETQAPKEEVGPETNPAPIREPLPPQGDATYHKDTEPTAPTPVKDGKHQDTVCPYCGGTNCQPVSRTTGKASGGGYSVSDGCCGMCMLGPIGLLCGIGGKGSKIDLKNEVVWVCRSCGKQHLSQKDALGKAIALGTSYGTGAAIIGLVISVGMFAYGWSWIFAVLWAFSPLVVYGMVSEEVEKELGYPMEEILPPNMSPVKILLISEILMILLLWLGGDLLDSFFEQLSQS